jgi:hypothetical protein
MTLETSFMPTFNVRRVGSHVGFRKGMRAMDMDGQMFGIFFGDSNMSRLRDGIRQNSVFSEPDFPPVLPE